MHTESYVDSGYRRLWFAAIERLPKLYRSQRNFELCRFLTTLYHSAMYEPQYLFIFLLYY